MTGRCFRSARALAGVAVLALSATGSIAAESGKVITGSTIGQFEDFVGLSRRAGPAVYELSILSSEGVRCRARLIGAVHIHRGRVLRGTPRGALSCSDERTGALVMRDGRALSFSGHLAGRPILLSRPRPPQAVTTLPL